MSLSSFQSALHHNRLFQWWLRLQYARTPRFRPLLRAEFARDCFYDQASFLLRAGYYNASVCMTRFAVEKQLMRLALITPRWKEYRCKTLHGRVSFLYHTGVISKKTRRQFESWGRRANKFVHETNVPKSVAMKIVVDAEDLRLAIEEATRKTLRT